MFFRKFKNDVNQFPNKLEKKFLRQGTKIKSQLYIILEYQNKKMCSEDEGFTILITNSEK